MPRSDGSIMVENAEIIWRNFEGRKGVYNAEGKRNFSLILEPELAEQLEADGWNVKRKPPYEEGADERITLPVEVKFDGKFPPILVLLTSRGRTTLKEDQAEILDMVEIEKVDLVVRPYSWEVNGNSGVKAYLKAIYVTMYEDYLMLKYADIPEIGSEPARLQIESGPEHNVIQGTVVRGELESGPADNYDEELQY